MDNLCDSSSAVVGRNSQQLHYRWIHSLAVVVGPGSFDYQLDFRPPNSYLTITDQRLSRTQRRSSQSFFKLNGERRNDSADGIKI